VDFSWQRFCFLSRLVNTSPIQNSGNSKLSEIQESQRDAKPSPILAQLVKISGKFLKGKTTLKTFQDQIQDLFHSNGISISPNNAANFALQLNRATIHWLASRNASRKAVDLPPVYYANYTPGPSGLNPGDPRTYSMAPNPGAKVILTGGLLLVTSPIWGPAIAETAGVLYSACLTNPTTCISIGSGMGQGVLKGGFDLETGLPPSSPHDFWSQKIFEGIFFLNKKINP